MNFHIMSLTNVSISTEVHKLLVSHLSNGERKIGKFAESAIKEKIEKESKTKKKNG